MSLSWWNSRDPAATDDVESIGTPKMERNHTHTKDGGSSAAVPGSPSIVFLSRPIVVGKLAGEKTGLLPTLNRPESRASKQIRRCQLVAVVVMSVVTAAVIILFWAGDPRPGDG